MPRYESESIVLRSYDLAEADRIIVFFTRKYGIIRGVAKGVKRLKSRFGSALEPFAIVDLEYFSKEDRELVTIDRVDLLRSSFSGSSDHQTLAVRAYLADLVTAFLPPSDPNEDLYRMVRGCLGVDIGTPARVAAICFYFEHWMLRLGGYLPDWTKCGMCGARLEGEESIFLRPDLVALCRGCRENERSATGISMDQAFYMIARRTGPEEFVAKAENFQDDVRGFSDILKRYISKTLGRELPTAKMIVEQPR
jgi:DNA repair protein RecO (recombination protein O)